MNLRKRAEPQTMGFQIAPMVDILLVLLCFFIVTWSFAKKELDLPVRVPSAQNATESASVVNQTVLNIRTDGTVVWNNKIVPRPELLDRLKELSGLYPDYSIIVRGDENAKFTYINAVLDVCREANIWNVAFATRKAE
ncbi:MAG: biopolymer transporter ExbD [Chthoniobacter sp.]|nr:biopolymer transporter ExbD [Chthoniobacter sp.]